MWRNACIKAETRCGGKKIKKKIKYYMEKKNGSNLAVVVNPRISASQRPSRVLDGGTRVRVDERFAARTVGTVVHSDIYIYNILPDKKQVREGVGGRGPGGEGNVVCRTRWRR